jgi:hypothetical protein
LLGPCVEGGRGLVQDHEERLPAHERAGQRHLLPLALREVGPALEVATQLGLVPVREPLQERRGTAGGRGRLDPGAVADLRQPADPDRLAGQEPEADEVLVRTGRRRPPAVQVEVPKVHAVDCDRSLVGVVEAAQELDDGRLAGAVVADERHGRARRQDERHTVQRRPLTPVVAERHIVETDAGGQRRRHRPRIVGRGQRRPVVEEPEVAPGHVGVTGKIRAERHAQENRLAHRALEHDDPQGDVAGRGPPRRRQAHQPCHPGRQEQRVHHPADRSDGDRSPLAGDEATDHFVGLDPVPIDEPGTEPEGPHLLRRRRRGGQVDQLPGEALAGKRLVHVHQRPPAGGGGEQPEADGPQDRQGQQGMNAGEHHNRRADAEEAGEGAGQPVEEHAGHPGVGPHHFHGVGVASALQVVDPRRPQRGAHDRAGRGLVGPLDDPALEVLPQK